MDTSKTLGHGDLGSPPKADIAGALTWGCFNLKQPGAKESEKDGNEELKLGKMLELCEVCCTYQNQQQEWYISSTIVIKVQHHNYFIRGIQWDTSSVAISSNPNVSHSLVKPGMVSSF